MVRCSMAVAVRLTMPQDAQAVQDLDILRWTDPAVVSPMQSAVSRLVGRLLFPVGQ